MRLPHAHRRSPPTVHAGDPTRIAQTLGDARALCLAFVLALAASCQDAPTTPAPTPLGATRTAGAGGLRYDAAPVYADSTGVTQFSSVDVPVGNSLNPDGSGRLGVFPRDKYTLLYLTVAGQNQMTGVNANVYPSSFVAGPAGIDCHWGMRVYNDSGGTGGGGFVIPCGRLGDTGPVAVYGLARGIVFGHQDGNAGSAPSCGGPCYSVSGGFTMQAWAPRAQLSLTATRSGDTTTVRPGDLYQLSVVITPNQIGGHGVPRYVQGWRFVEDGTGAVTTMCSTETTCNYWPTRAGRVQVTVWVNSYVQTAEYPVVMGPIGLALKPSRRSVPVGDTVTFTPVPTPAGASVEVLGWRWQPDSGTAGSSVCATAALCTMAIAQSGTMTVQARVQGTVRSATTRVTIVPCPTRNAILDDSTVRAGLNALWASSNPNAPSDSNRIEHGAWIIRGADDGYSVQPFPSNWPADGCGIDPPPGTMPPAGAVAWVHTHGWTQGELQTACPPVELNFGGRKFKRYVNYNGNPSSGDMNAASVWSGIASFMIDKNQIRQFDATNSNIASFVHCWF